MKTIRNIQDDCSSINYIHYTWMVPKIASKYKILPYDSIYLIRIIK
jgi:hypothetical protein